MGKYVDSQLVDDESVVYTAKVHWAAFLKGLVLCVLGFIFDVTDIGGALLLIGIVLLISELMTYLTTELVITNKRVIAKFGWIRRKTFEQQLDRIEGANLNQSILGRILGYASIVIRGTGGGSTPIPFIAEPDNFKRDLATRLS